MNIFIKTALPVTCLLITFSCKKENSNRQLPIRDDNASNMIAGKYTSININGQRWMTRNLDVTHYRNGDRIPEVKRPEIWDTLTTGAWCWYNNDSALGAIYGRLYNFYAVNDQRGLAPLGWHISSRAEWDTLAERLGGFEVAGGKLKDTGTFQSGTGLWYEPNRGATNSTGFTALPGGARLTPLFDLINQWGEWWTSTTINDTCWYNKLSYANHKLRTFYGFEKRFGYSIRCVKD